MWSSASPALPSPSTEALPPARRRRPGRGAAWCAVLLGLWLAACSPAPAQSTPDGAARAFVERIVQFDGNERDAQAIFEMLSERSRKNLRARAERYGAASGRKIAPAAMLVPSRMAPRFSARSYSAQIVGKYALVDVRGVQAGQRAQIPCVLEDDDGWRVDLVLPELPPMRIGPGREP